MKYVFCDVTFTKYICKQVIIAYQFRYGGIFPYFYCIFYGFPYDFCEYFLVFYLLYFCCRTHINEKKCVGVFWS